MTCTRSWRTSTSTAPAPDARRSTAGAELLARYRWPGNVRELPTSERLAILHVGGDRTNRTCAPCCPSTAYAPPHPLPDPTALDSSLTDTLDEHERTLIVRALSWRRKRGGIAPPEDGSSEPVSAHAPTRHPGRRRMIAPVEGRRRSLLLLPTALRTSGRSGAGRDNRR
jgi:hypothetical protein